MVINDRVKITATAGWKMAWTSIRTGPEVGTVTVCVLVHTFTKFQFTWQMNNDVIIEKHWDTNIMEEMVHSNIEQIVAVFG